MSDELKHEGTRGMHWGVRKYQFEDGTYTEAGKERYFGTGKGGKTTKASKEKEERHKAKQKAARDRLKTRLEKEKVKAEIAENKHQQRMNKLAEKAIKENLKKEKADRKKQQADTKREAEAEKSRLKTEKVAQKAEQYELNIQKKLDKQDEKAIKSENRARTGTKFALTTVAALMLYNKYKGSKSDNPIASAIDTGKKFTDSAKSEVLSDIVKDWEKVPSKSTAVGAYLGRMGFTNGPDIIRNGHVVIDI